jgi:N-sulfoglucosamine sulfohydrolase
MTKYNILYIHSHDTGRHIQPYGFPVQTPSLMKLAQQGTLFRHAFCVASSCSAARASFMTSLYPSQNGMTGLAHRGWHLTDYGKTLVSFLKDQGYHTALMGESHITPYDQTDLVGYDEVVQDNSTPTEQMVEVAQKWFERPPTQPWFLSCGFWDTHRTAYPEPSPERAKYGDVMPGFPDTPDLRADYAAFCQATERLDWGMGQVFEALEKSGQADNTIVIATTDHAPGFPTYKANVSDKGLGVFMIIRAPGTKSGLVYEPIVNHLDVFPTIADLIGVGQPDWVEGSSLVPVLQGSDQPLHDAIYGQANYHAAYEPQRSLRTEQYRYYERFTDRTDPVRPNIDDGATKQHWLAGTPQHVPYNLYDIIRDPLEQHNLAYDPAFRDVQQKLSKQLHAWQKKVKDPLLQGSLALPDIAEINHPDQQTSSDQTHKPTQTTNK